ncbi:molybdopterin molybdotransferase MoeA [Plastoroseomonas arctica]|uniref:Molybdopterin molybdenumtransferase n=1 Tax=Plastoroseomonas arctica TaxID=1509237 RepID=A0AAF1JWW3_9PROT|nr:gephyrin-like molybdotransferase Glp [Plastoroseomonas arctica]MBR0654233.1 molybdopterin molybdotransferase MoeA [Plastoroseomonas arctica]
MAQLTDDCFAFGGTLMGIDEAEALIASRIPALPGEEQAPLEAALGRILAQELVAPLPLPPFHNSAVDGYAFRHADLVPGTATPLLVAGRVAAGGKAVPLAPGTAARIFTGAPMPEASDTVIMQEDAEITAGAVLIPTGLKPGANARPAGEDVAQGSVALPAGRRLDAPAIGLAAALGLTHLGVAPRPRIGVFSTGDELAQPGTPLRAAQTYDSNRFTLLALLATLPVAATDLGILPDDAATTGRALRDAAATHDLLLTTGGVSTGEEDHVRAAIEATGALVLWRLAIKPGRPAAMGVIAGTPIIGLPGNPVAAVITFLHLARPMILRLAGATPRPLPRFAATADFSYRKKAGRREYVRVTLADTEDGLPVARKFPREGAGLLSSLTRSDAFAELPEPVTEVTPGDRLRVLPFAALFG